MPDDTAQPTKVTISYPQNYHIQPQGSSDDIPSGTRSRSAGENGTRQLALSLPELLKVTEASLEHSFSLHRNTQADSRSGNQEESLNPLSVQMQVAANEQAVLLLEEDGILTWILPDATTGDTTATQEVRSGADTVSIRQITFTVDLNKSAEPQNLRSSSLFATIKKAGDNIKGYVLKFGVGFIMDKGIKFLERNIERGLVHITGADPTKWVPVSDLSQINPATQGSLRLLLLVHGTFSSTVGSFGALGATLWGKSFLAQALEKYDAIIGYDHATLSEDPLENALEILRVLRTAGVKRELAIDAIAYSRGGLVLRSLIEMLLPQEDRPIKFDRAIFVGATNAGTTLAEPENWHDFINLYTNLSMAAARVVELLAGPVPAVEIANAAIKSMAAVVKYLATYSVNEGGIPGLAAMKPDGEFVRNINRTQPNQPSPDEIKYYAVTSNFEYSISNDIFKVTQIPNNLRKLLVDKLTNDLLVEANDLVVHTRSMTAIDAHVKGFVKEVCDFGNNPQVYHTIYFAQKETVRALGRWLEISITDERTRTHGADDGKLSAIESLLAQSEVQFKTPKRLDVPVTSMVLTADAEEKIRHKIDIEVHWNNIMNADGDIFGVGHYQGVEPQAAELALDEAISPAKTTRADWLLTSLTRRGMLRGELGSIDLFPWGDLEETGKLVAVCGMGYPGTFTESGLRLLYRNLIWYINSLHQKEVLTTVLIGSGNGTLTIVESIQGLLNGLDDALSASSLKSGLKTIRIVEYHKARAAKIHWFLSKMKDSVDLQIDLKPELIKGKHGVIGREYYLASLLDISARAARKRSTAKVRQALETLLGELDDDVEEISKTLRELDIGEKPGELVSRLNINIDSREEEENSVPMRISFTTKEDVYSVAAITDTATIPERANRVDQKLIRNLAREMTAPRVNEVQELSHLLFKLMVPREFRSLLSHHSPLIIEVDRSTAAIQWEMLSTSVDGKSAQPIALHRPVSRQLRTDYSSGPVIEPRRREHRALVIGDPCAAMRLPGAADEAHVVARILAQYGFTVDTLIGPEKGSRIEALKKLTGVRYDLIHYAGHGDYDVKDPSKTGWVFNDGILTAAEIERIDSVPPIVFANACLSSMLSEEPGEREARERRPQGIPGLLPSLADEFLRRGAFNYIGTAWEVNDSGAVDFAKQFYLNFLADSRAPGSKTISEALKIARNYLHQYRSEDALWAAYQHYGSPNFRLTDLYQGSHSQQDKR